MPKDKQRILIISHDKIGVKMAGPGIRYHYMAEVLSKSFSVTIGFFDPTYLPGKEFKRNYDVKHIDAHTFESGFQDADVVIALWLSESMLHFCNVNNIFTVFDLYAPVPVENLAKYIFSNKEITADIDAEFQESATMYRRFFENGDLFLTSNQRQLDYWIGYVFGTGLITPSLYNERPIYDRFIYAPMGIDTRVELPSSKKKFVMRNVLPGIKDTDKILLWTGGIWDWFDAQTLIYAMKALQDKRPDIKLVFFGTKHPNPSIPEMNESLQARKLAENLGLHDTTVIFKDGWVDYSERLQYLAEADAAIYTHKSSIETEFSHRTRVLDHILAELPTVATQGDYFADEVIEGTIGITCKANDPKALESAILSLFEDSTYKTLKKNLKKIRPDYDWSQTLGSLHDYLLTNPSKLKRTVSAPVLKPDAPGVKLAKKYLPVPVKRAVVRTRRRFRK